MKSKSHLLCLLALLPFTGCATSSSDMKLSEVPNNSGMLFGHISVYNGHERLDTGWTTRCTFSFSNEKGDQVAKVQADQAGWIFASAPVGKTYLSDVLCNAGYLKGQVELKTKELSFAIPQEKSAAYFGNVTIRFNYHGISLGGMFGLVGAVTEVASESGARNVAQTQIGSNFEAAEQIFQNRFGAGSGSFKLADETIAPHLPPPSRLPPAP